MIIRLLSAMVLVYLMGFVVFAVATPGKLEGVETDVVVVPTGSGGRIARGLEVLRDGDAKRMLVTGVDPEVTNGEFVAQFKVSRKLLNCCITLGHQASDTRGNATETVAWTRKVKAESVRLVTSDWHMRRASMELRRVMPGDILIYNDAVASRPSMRILFLEYNKLLASWLASLINW